MSLNSEMQLILSERIRYSVSPPNIVLLISRLAHRESFSLAAASSLILKKSDYSVGSHLKGGSLSWSQEIFRKAPIISAQ